MVGRRAGTSPAPTISHLARGIVGAGLVPARRPTIPARRPTIPARPVDFPYFTSTVKDMAMMYIGHICPFLHSAWLEKASFSVPVPVATKRHTQILLLFQA